MIYLFERVILVRNLEESILLQNTKFIQFTDLVYEHTGKFSSFRPISDA